MFIGEKMKKRIIILLFVLFSVNLYCQSSPKTIAECVKNKYFETIDIIEDENNINVDNHKICRAYIFKTEEDFDLYIKYILELNYIEDISMKTIFDLKALAAASNEDSKDFLDYKILKQYNAEFMVYQKYYTVNDINYRKFFLVRLYKDKIYSSYNVKRNAY